MTIEHRRIACGEVTLHIAEAKASDDAPLVVLLHGYPELWYSWRHQLEALAADGIWAVAPDLRGYNESDRPDRVGAYDIEHLAADVAGLVRALGRQHATIVGHDWGGMVAWAVASLHPEIVERLAVLNIPHPRRMLQGFLRLGQLRKSWYIFFFQIPRLPERAIARGDFAYMRRELRQAGFDPQEIEQYVAALRIPGALRAALAYYRAAMRRVVTGRIPEMRRIDVPVLVIWGDRDKYLGTELAEPPRDLVPDVTVVHLPDATHWVQHDAADRVSELLVDFVRSTLVG
jgi:epoxide hydrolase 4